MKIIFCIVDVREMRFVEKRDLMNNHWKSIHLLEFLALLIVLFLIFILSQATTAA